MTNLVYNILMAGSIIILTLIIFLLAEFMVLLDAKTYEIKRKSEKLRMETRSIRAQKYQKPRELSFEEKSNNTTNFMNLVTLLVTMEIHHKLRNVKELGQRYELLHMDEDISDISKAVLEGLDPSIFKEDRSDCLLDRKSMMTFIIKLSSDTFIKEVREYNQSLRRV